MGFAICIGTLSDAVRSLFLFAVSMLASCERLNITLALDFDLIRTPDKQSEFIYKCTIAIYDSGCECTDVFEGSVIVTIEGQANSFDDLKKTLANWSVGYQTELQDANRIFEKELETTSSNPTTSLFRASITENSTNQHRAVTPQIETGQTTLTTPGQHSTDTLPDLSANGQEQLLREPTGLLLRSMPFFLGSLFGFGIVYGVYKLKERFFNISLDWKKLMKFGDKFF